MEAKEDIIIFNDDNLSIEVRIDLDKDTVWLTQRQMAELFDVSYDNINLHIRNIINDKELSVEGTTEESSVVQREGNKKVNRKLLVYNLDMIVSVGYRVKSKRGITFRRWANKVLKDYLLKGYAINEQQLINNKKYYSGFTESIKFISELYKRKNLTSKEKDSLFNIINKYSYALETLDKYDYRELRIDNITKDEGFRRLVYKDILSEIKNLPDYKNSRLFGREKDKSFEGSINAIYQTAFGEEVYPSIEEKAANLLYFVVKNHSFIDGNKRIAASIFVWFLNNNSILYKEDGSKLIEDNTLVALVLMVALSDPKEREVVVKIIINLINKDN